MINKAFKIRLYPTVRQAKFFNKTFGTCRFIYNQFMALKKSIYEETRMSFTPKLSSFKEEWPWMREWMNPLSLLILVWLHTLSRKPVMPRMVTGKPTHL